MTYHDSHLTDDEQTSFAFNNTRKP